MARDLQSEIKQKKPFQSKEEELFLNITRTADLLQRRGEALFKQAGLSGNQYNVLRILRGAAPEGLACGEIGERMVTRDPDITRLLDRLEKRSLVKRARGKDDRRVVTTRITPAGLDLLKQLDEPLQAILKNQLGHMEAKRQEALIRLLEAAREKT
jgi:DNA-binding MarR family transcriptional regulator